MFIFTAMIRLISAVETSQKICLQKFDPIHYIFNFLLLKMQKNMEILLFQKKFVLFRKELENGKKSKEDITMKRTSTGGVK